ncbi:hypothetical protein ACFSC4_20875 [Deinococcus malanensis]|uniref:hypothetical protein n=1 Tax=Deinococcus malanensis TaxID=1706855 RepID=UPI00166BE10B|nr:hypothetical protein [Deinococcus malanensis]
MALDLLDVHRREVLASSGEVFPEALARAVRTRVESEGDRSLGVQSAGKPSA